MSAQFQDPAISKDAAGMTDAVTEGRGVARPKAETLRNAIFKSAYFSCIATDERGIIQLFNAGAEFMLGYTAIEVVDKINAAQMCDPQELIASADALSIEFATPIAPGFECLAFKAARGIEDTREFTGVHKDGSRFSAALSITALRDEIEAIIGFLLITSHNTVGRRIEGERKQLDQRLSDQQFYTRSLIESNIDALIATDPSGIMTDVNKQTEALTDRNLGDAHKAQALR